jgi:hypothetical protein
MTTKMKWAIGIIAVAGVAYFTRDKWMPIFKGGTATPPADSEKKSGAAGAGQGVCGAGMCAKVDKYGQYDCVPCNSKGASMRQRSGRKEFRVS